MSDSNDENFRRPYMTNLPRSSVRQLPPEKDHRDRNHKHVTTGPDINILSLYGLEPSYHNYPNKDPERLEWRDSDVKGVVNYYLKASTHGHGNPMQPQPTTMCHCCMSINDTNKRRKAATHLTELDSRFLKGRETERPKSGSRPASPEERPAPHDPEEPKQVRFVGMGDQQTIIPAIPYYRSDDDGPDLMIADPYYQDYKSDDLPPANSYGSKPDHRTVFVTHPVRTSLYTNWGINEEVGGFSRDRYIAEDVVTASSKYVNSMQKLKNYADK